jgi:hypothetical protein
MPSPESLKSLLLQISTDAEEYQIQEHDLETIWKMGLSAYLTAQSFGLIPQKTEEDLAG